MVNQKHHFQSLRLYPVFLMIKFATPHSTWGLERFKNGKLYSVFHNIYTPPSFDPCFHTFRFKKLRGYFGRFFGINLMPFYDQNLSVSPLGEHHEKGGQ